MLLCAVPLYWAFGARFGAAGLAASGALAISANALATLALARRLHGAPHLGVLVGSALRALGIAGVAAFAAHAVAARVLADAEALWPHSHSSQPVAPSSR